VNAKTSGDYKDKLPIKTHAKRR